jgi:hypothetical protein
MHPFLADGDPEILKRTLKSLSSLDVECLVPGHGEAGGPGLLNLMIDYVEMTEMLAADLISQDKKPEDFKPEDLPDPYSSWLFPNFFVRNLKFIYLKLR